MPGYTHLQRAQPVYLAHHLLAYLWMLAARPQRFAFAADSAARLPLGSGALAGVASISTAASSPDLGFEEWLTPSMASGIVFVLDYLALLPPAPLTCRASGPSSSSGQAGSSASAGSPMPAPRAPRSCPRVNPTPPSSACQAPRVLARLRPWRSAARAATHRRQGHAGGQGNCSMPPTPSSSPGDRARHECGAPSRASGCARRPPTRCSR